VPGFEVQVRSSVATHVSERLEQKENISGALMANKLEWQAETEWQASTDFGVYRIKAERGTVWLITPGSHQGTPCLSDIVTAKAVAEMHYREMMRVREVEGLASKKLDRQ
jgi:hypothetical protein